jgi:hypothetical protein
MLQKLHNSPEAIWQYLPRSPLNFVGWIGLASGLRLRPTLQWTTGFSPGSGYGHSLRAYGTGNKKWGGSVAGRAARSTTPGRFVLAVDTLQFTTFDRR